jgi:pimeloyl-ACP methyl ester carboxylesterase
VRVLVQSDGLQLEGHLARPPDDRARPVRPGLVLCHGFPAGPVRVGSSTPTYPALADRIAAEVGWTVLTVGFRGVDGSDGDFSLGGWLADLRAAIGHLLAYDDVAGVWLAGASTGGSLAICAGGEDERVQGVAALSARADFDDWAAHPRRFLDHAREIGVVRDPSFPEEMEAWTLELKQVRPLSLVAALSPRPLLLVQGSDDGVVPVADARALADCHGGAELRVVQGAGHNLRHDPRAIAVLLGWLERQAEEDRPSLPGEGLVEG